MSTNLTPIALALGGFVGCSILMTVAWVVSVRLNFFSLVDAVWALGIGCCSAFYHLIFGGNHARSVFSVGIILLWSFRLGVHLIRRMRTHFPIEDSRYVRLKASWASGFAVKSFLFFQFQAVTQALFSYPFAVTALDGSEFPRVVEIIGFVVAVVGVVGESISDSQLKRFKENPLKSGRVCNVGLWRYSRHPNYFFEWVIWCGFGTLALGGPMGVLALLCPVVMLLLLVFVTGVAPSEAQSIRSRGEEYIRYQQTTSRFIPWFPKKGAT